MGLLLGCSPEEQGTSPYVEEGTGSSDPAVVQVSANVETNSAPPSQNEDSAERPLEEGDEGEVPQDREGESDADTGDDANPDSVNPQAG